MTHFSDQSHQALEAWPIRAIQLDLARQRETLGAIADFSHFASALGFNTLVLYLEGAVRTSVFPYRPAVETYSEEDIRRIVDTAGEAGLEVVPAFNAPGHAEHFVECPELAHLATPHPGIGRAHFDTSKPEVYQFLSDYLGGLAELFPGKHMHMGGDEAWRFGRDPESRHRRDQGESWGQQYARHLHRMRDIAAGCGKRPWFWADMLEYFDDDALQALPRDAVMVNWSYAGDAIERDGPQGHFCNRQRRDWFAIYQQLGIEAMIAPCADTLFATERATDWARQNSVLGGIQTLWEMSTAFLPSIKTQVAATGLLWSQPELTLNDAFNEATSRLFPGSSPTERAAIRVATDDLLWLNRQISDPTQLLNGRWNQNETRHYHALRLADTAFENLEAEPSRFDEAQRDILAHLRLRLSCQLLNADLQAMLAEETDPRNTTPPDVRNLQRYKCSEKLQIHQAQFEQHWQQQRPSITKTDASDTARHASSQTNSLLEQIDRTPHAERAMLRLNLFMPDSFAAPHLRICIQEPDGLRQIHDGQIKARDISQCHYDHQAPLRWNAQGDTVLRIIASGYGSIGIRYLQVVTRDARWVPAEVSVVRGEVRGARYILRDDITSCMLGLPDVTTTLIDAEEGLTTEIKLVLRAANSAKSAD